MTCETVKDAISEYLDGMLCDTKQKEVESHLAACLGCRQDVQEVRETLGWLKQAGEISPPETLRPSVLAQLKREKAQQKRRFAPGIPQAMAAAVIFLLLVAGNVTMNVNRTPWDMRSLAPQSDSAEVDTLSEPSEAPSEIGTTDTDGDGDLFTTDTTSEKGEFETREGTRNSNRILFNLLLLPLFFILTLRSLKKRKDVMP